MGTLGHRFSGSQTSKRSGFVTVLDIGSAKITCMIAKLTPCPTSSHLPLRTHKIDVLGIGHQRSRGIKSGVISDLEQAEQAIRQAVDAAERMAGMTADSIIVNISSGRLKSSLVSATINLSSSGVKDHDIARVMNAGIKNAATVERKHVHVLPLSYSIDAERGIRDPLGMEGSQLGMNMHVLAADAAPLRNIELCINRAHLSVESMVASPYACGLAVLADDEAELGAACIDFGAGTTSLGIFNEGRFCYGDAIAVGGHNVTMDLARGLSTRLDDAEALKARFGTVLTHSLDDNEMISVCSINDAREEAMRQIPRSIMTKIIKARVEETLELIRDRLNRSGFANIVGKRIVLTGGASQLQGLPELARHILGRSVRIGRPLGVTGLLESARGPAFATSVGLIIYPQVADIERHSPSIGGWGMSGTGGRFAHVKTWLRENF
jgi:cell division protein FtsA